MGVMKYATDTSTNSTTATASGAMRLSHGLPCFAFWFSLFIFIIYYMAENGGAVLCRVPRHYFLISVEIGFVRTANIHADIVGLLF